MFSALDDTVARFGVPNTDGVVVGPGCDPATVSGPGYAAHCAFMTLDALEAVPCLRIPDPN